MSQRHTDFLKLVKWLENSSGVFNAPYGIIESEMVGKYEGSVMAYTVTFGCCRTWDATVKVFSETKVVLESSGQYKNLPDGEYGSVDKLIDALEHEFFSPF